MKKKLVLISMDIDSNVNFKVYRTQLIIIDDYLMWYKSNFNRIIYNIILKIEYSGPVLKLTGGNIIK